MGKKIYLIKSNNVRRLKRNFNTFTNEGAWIIAQENSLEFLAVINLAMPSINMYGTWINWKSRISKASRNDNNHRWVIIINDVRDNDERVLNLARCCRACWHSSCCCKGIWTNDSTLCYITQNYCVKISSYIDRIILDKENIFAWVNILKISI